MNRLTRSDRVRILRLLVEGMGINATSRATNISKPSVLKLLVDIGKVCAEYQDVTLRELPCKRIQCDEIWAFVQAKDKVLQPEERNTGKRGSVWTWTAICADTKIVPSFMVGTRDAVVGDMFMHDLANRLSNRVQLTTDGHKAYLSAVDNNFGNDIDYAMLIKLYGNEGGGATPERRYSPGECTGIRIDTVTGAPAHKHISTSYVERQNLTMRMSMRRFTRLTNGFSKKAGNHLHAISLHFMYYNFCRIHKTLRVTPAMAAGVCDHVWELEEVVALLEKAEAEADAANPVRPGRKPKTRTENQS